MLNIMFSIVDGIQTALLLFVLTKKRPAFWKVGAITLWTLFIIYFIKPLVLEQLPPLMGNMLVAFFAMAAYTLPLIIIFRRPFHDALVTSIYSFFLTVVLQFAVVLLLLLLGIWVNIEEYFMLLAQAMYFPTMLSLVLFKPAWLQSPHHKLMRFVSQRPHFSVVIDTMLLALFLLFSSSFLIELLRGSLYISTRSYTIVFFIFVILSTFIVLFRMILNSHQNSTMHRHNLQVNEIVSTIDQMIYQGHEKGRVLSHLCDGVKSLYPKAATCEVYTVSDQNQLIAAQSSTFIPLEETLYHKKEESAYRSVLLSGRTEAESASYPEIDATDQSMLHIPLTLGGELYALLLISSKNQDAFDDDSLTLARNLKEQLEQVMEKHRSYREAIHGTTHDDITGLFNRRHTEEKILQLMSDHDQKDRRFALVLVTLLNLDRIRSDYGDEQMKKHLKDFADFLKDHAKESHLIGRHSENEFVLILPLADRIAVDDYMNDIKAGLNAGSFEPIKPHFHYGVSFYPDTARSLTRLISAADQQIVVSRRLKESMEMI